MSYVNLPHDHGGDVGRVMEHMPAGGAFQAIADVFKLMDDPSRIRIFWLLCHCEECVINISALVDMSSPAPIQDALDLFGTLLDEMEKLMEE